MAKDPYGLEPAFERAVAVLCATEPRFWAKVGREVDPECMAQGPARLAVQAARLIAKDQGSGPRSALTVLQRLARASQSGKLHPDRVREVATMLEDAEDAGLPPLDEVVSELAPILKRRIQSAAILEAHAQFARHGDFVVVSDMIAKAQQVGVSEGAVGFKIGAHGFESIAALRKLGRLPTGILELDMALKGGMMRGKLGVVVGDSGAGKSVFLASVACEGVRNKLRVAVATLEISEEETFARVAAGLTGVPIDLILEVEDKRLEAERRLELMLPDIGVMHIGEFQPHITTVREIVDWVDGLEQTDGAAVDLVVVDYGDKLHAPQVTTDNEYLAMRYVFEGMRRDGAKAKNQWWWTASQAKGAPKGKDVLDLNSAADSKHKARVSDLMITINVRDEGNLYFVAKNRGGPSRMMIGPLPTDFERGRITPVSREWRQW